MSEASPANTRSSPLLGVRVCVVGINFPPEPSGIAPYTGALAAAAAAAGASVQVVTGMPHYPWWRVPRSYRYAIRREETTVDGVRVSRRRHWVPASPSLVGRLSLELTFLLHALPTVLASRADVVVAVTPSGSGPFAALAGHRGRPWGAIVQDLMGNAAGQSRTAGAGTAGRLARLEYAMLRHADLVGVITPRFGEILTANGVVPERVRDVANFSHVETATVSREEARRRLGWPVDDFLLVHTGNIGRKQGLEVLVDAALRSEAAGDGVGVVVVGDGNQRAEIRKRANGCRSIRFVDPLPEDEYPLALAAADVLALVERPGVVNMSLPSKLTSYVTAARPILASIDPTGLTHDYVARRGLARCVPAGDAEVLLDAARELRDRPDECARLVDAGTALHQRELSAEAANARYVQFIAELAGR